MPTIAQAIADNNARKAGQTKTVSAPVAPVPFTIAPTPPQDLPVGLGLPQRGMFSTSVASVADRNDNARVFRGQGVRSATFPGNQTQSNITTKVTTTNVSVTPATSSSSGITTVINDTNILGSITGQNLTLGWSGQLSIARGGTGTSTPTLVAGTNVTITGTWPNQTINASSGGGGVTSVFGRTGVVVSAVGDYNFSQISGTINISQEPSTTVNAITNDTNVTGVITAQNLALGWTGTLSIARGGTGTTTPTLVAGSNTTITGSWPNQTINALAASGGASPLTRRWAYASSCGIAIGSTGSCVGDIFNGTNQGAWNAASATVKYPYTNFTESTSGQASGCNGAKTWRPEANILWQCRLQVGTVTSLRLVLGMGDSTSMANWLTADTLTANYAAFRFSTSASDANWQCITGDGSGSVTKTDSGVAVAINTDYTLQIKFNASVPNVSFIINGTTVATSASHLPTTGVDIANWCGVQCLATGARNWLAGWIYYEADY